MASLFFFHFRVFQSSSQQFIVNLPIRFDQIVFHIFFVFFHFPTCFFPCELRKWNSSLRIFPTDFPTYQNNGGDFPQLFQFPNMFHTIHLPWISNQIISKYTIHGWYGCVCLSKLRFGNPCSTLFLLMGTENWTAAVDGEVTPPRPRMVMPKYQRFSCDHMLLRRRSLSFLRFFMKKYRWNIAVDGRYIYVNSHRCPFFTGFTELRYLKWYRISSESVYMAIISRNKFI